MDAPLNGLPNDTLIELIRQLFKRVRELEKELLRIRKLVE